MKRITGWTSIVVIVALGLTGCQREEPSKSAVATVDVSDSPTAVPAEPERISAPEDARVTKALRAVYVRNLGSLPAYAAKQNTLLDKLDAAMEIIEPPMSSKACLDLLHSGEADLCFGVDLGTLLAAETSAPGMLMILGYSAETMENPCGAFLVPKASAVTSLDDLRGQEVAAAGDDCAGRLAGMLLAKPGEPPPEIAVLSLDAPGAFDFESPDAPKALFAVGPVMASLTKGMPAERAARAIAQGGLARRFFSPFPLHAIVIRRALTTENPKGLAAAARAIDSLLDWCNGNYAEILPTLQTEFGLDDESTLNLILPRFVKRGEIAAPDLARAEALWTGMPPSEESPARLKRMEVSNQ